MGHHRYSFKTRTTKESHPTSSVPIGHWRILAGLTLARLSFLEVSSSDSLRLNLPRARWSLRAFLGGQMIARRSPILSLSPNQYLTL
ncbi:hypothetical protein PCASD_11616 [Puccinia coronata f. sp. avenae]|uniref:Uncharacterized protein n=1 Tax=Puccinia coronata f. sp. avenae TaxID=200324 RepID=A0A2N5U8P4_9BASI|nr:hypothetical protein PCASD_11616 [Puccinia coronata f. sp. avenae]